MQLGQKIIELNSGITQYVGPEYQGGNLTVRDWSTPDEKVLGLPLSKMALPQVRVEAGVENIRKNKSLTVTGQGIREIKRGTDTAILIGSGPSISYWANSLCDIHEIGTTFVMNRALKLFAGNEDLVDYAWLSDPMLANYADDWLAGFRTHGTDVITSFSTAYEIIKDFKNHYFFGLCVGEIKEWLDEQEAQGIDKTKFGVLDTGLCGLFSQLHLCFKLDFKRIILLGHDFALTHNFKYFDKPFNFIEQRMDENHHPDFDFEIAEDLRGNLITTQPYLFRQAQLIGVACQMLTEKGIKIINATEGGLLSGFGIELINLKELIESEKAKSVLNQE